MSTEITVVVLDPQCALEVSAETSMLMIPKTLGNCFAAVTRHMDSIGASKDGAPFTQYLDLDWNFIRTGSSIAQFWQLLTHKQKLRVGIPVGAEVQSDGEIAFAKIFGGRFVKALHIGSYHKLGKTYKELSVWASRNGVLLDNTAFESYISDPGEVPADKLETLVFVPIAD